MERSPAPSTEESGQTSPAGGELFPWPFLSSLSAPAAGLEAAASPEVGAPEARKPEHPSWNLEVGTPIAEGRWVLERLGGGSRYEVYLVWDDRLFALVVAKILRPDQAEDARALRELRHEAEVLERLAHPVLVRGFGAVLEGRYPHVLLEHLEGPTLRRLISTSSRSTWPRSAGGSRSSSASSRPTASGSQWRRRSKALFKRSSRVGRFRRQGWRPRRRPGTGDRVTQALNHFQLAQEYLRRWDWTGFGAELRKLEVILRGLEQATKPKQAADPVLQSAASGSAL